MHVKPFYILFKIALSFVIKFHCYGQTVNGTILNDQDKPVAYANIGVRGRSIGTVADQNGNFKLDISRANPNEVFLVSCLGYQSYSMLVKELGDAYLNIVLLEKITELDPVVVRRKNPKEKKRGSTKAWGIMNTGWPRGSLGGERGVKIVIPENSRHHVTSINYHIDINQYDSVLFRLRIRTLDDDKKPAADILEESIFLKTAVSQGWQKHDLSDRNIILDQESYSLSLEFVKAWGKCLQDQCLHISINMASGTFYVKEASFDSWIIKKLRSPTIYATTIETY